MERREPQAQCLESAGRSVRTSRAAGTGLLAALVLSIMATGCNAPAVVEGVVADESFQLRDDTPALRQSRGTMHIVLNEEQGETLRVVSLDVPNFEAQPLETDIPIASEPDSDDDVKVTVSTGTLTETIRSDGARIVSSEDNTFAEVTGGTLVFFDKDDLVNGSFTLDLADGGQLEGSFSISRR